MERLDRDPAELASGSMHDGRLGRRAFIGGVLGAAAGMVALPYAAGAVEPGASYFVPTNPSRLCDTRAPRVGIGFRRLAPNTIRVTCIRSVHVPAEAVAVVLTVTGVNLKGGGNWLGAYPAGTPFPGTSNSNSETFDERIANLVTVKLGTGSGDARGGVDIRSLGPSEVVVDVVGYYLPTSGPVRAGRFESITPFRAIDTRSGRQPQAGQVVPIVLDSRIPADAIAAVVNVTVADTRGRGFITTYPFGARRPNASSLNYDVDDIRAAATIAKLGTTSSGKVGFYAYTMASASIIVDVLGYITGPTAPQSSDGLFVPINPVRMHDTRRQQRRVWPGGTTSFALPSDIRSKARAVAMNLTVTSTIGPGYFTAYAARTPRRSVSTVNAVRAGQTVANHAFSQVSTSGVSCFAQRGAHVICDVAGYYTGTPVASSTGWPVVPNPPGGPIPWLLSVPRLGLTRWVYDGDPDRIVDAGNVWHWTGTGLVGQGTASVMFAHRTEAGGPLRYQHRLRAGDMAHVYTSDGRRYDYRMAAETVTGKWSSQILAASRRLPGDTISLVSCSRTDRLPTSLQYRLVSTFVLAAWHDIG